MVVSCPSVLLVSVTLLCTFTSCVAVTAGKSPVTIHQAATQLVQDIRTTVAKAKNGRYLNTLNQDILYLQTRAFELLENFPGEVSECETKLVIKMAAAGTGSHEVLTVMLAQDALSVLNGRLALSLAFLEHVAGQLEDELSLSSEIAPHLSAIVFGTNTTAIIIDTADKTVKSVSSPSTITIFNNKPKKQSNNDLHRRVRRQSVKLGSGWSLGLGGVKWESRSGMTTFRAKPTWSGFKPTGFRASLSFRF